MGWFRLSILLITLLAAGCGRVTDSEQLRLCRLILPVLHAEGTEIEEIRVAPRGRSGLRIDYAAREPGSVRRSHFVACGFGGATFELFLPALRRSCAELHRSKRFASALDLLSLLLERRLAGVELGGTSAQLRLTEIELQRAVAEDLLDPEMELTGALLALLERHDRLPNLRRALLELLPVLGEQVRDLVGGVGGHEQRAQAFPWLRLRRTPRPLLPFGARLRRSFLHTSKRRRHILSRRVRMSRRRVPVRCSWTISSPKGWCDSSVRGRTEVDAARRT